MSDREHIVAKTLRIVRADFERLIMPNLTNANAQTAAYMIKEILDYLTIWYADLPDAMDTHLATRREILARIGGPDPDEAGGPLASDLLVDDTDYGALSEQLERRIGRHGEGRLSTTELGAIVRADLALYDAELALIKAEQQAAKVRVGLVETEVTTERLTALLTPLYGADSGFEVSGFSRAAGGYAKDTFLVDVKAPDGRAERLAVRRDLPFPSTGNRIADEYAALKRLAPLGLPIAEPLLCDSAAILGQAAMVSRGVAGAAGIPGATTAVNWGEDSAVARAVCHELATVMARLHSLSPDTLGVTYDPDPAQQLRAYVIEWRDRWLDFQIHPSPTLAAGFRWMLDNIPQHIAKLSIVHGDIGFHNTMVHDGEITALLDWEFIHIGDPVEDLGYCRPAIEALVPWSEFLEVYQAHGGAEYVEESARFFEVWRSVRNAVCCAGAWRGFLGGEYPALKMAFQGVPLYRYFVQQVAESLEGELK